MWLMILTFRCRKKNQHLYPRTNFKCGEGKAPIAFRGFVHIKADTWMTREQGDTVFYLNVREHLQWTHSEGLWHLLLPAN